MRYAFDDAGRGRAARDAVLRDVLQPRHLPQGLDGGHPPHDAVGHRPSCRPFADDAWELYDTNTDWTQAHDLAAEMPEKLAELKALFMEEARKYNVLPARRPARRALQLRPRRAAGADQGQLAAAVRRHGPADRELGDQHQEQVALGDRRDRRSRTAAPRA